MLSGPLQCTCTSITLGSSLYPMVKVLGWDLIVFKNYRKRGPF